MSVIEEVKVMKKIQPTTLLLIKIGQFVYSYGKDAYIISYIFKYNVKQLENKIYVCGFSKNKLKNIVANLENQKIDFLVLDRKNSYREDEKSNNKNLNKYNDIFEKAKKYVKRKQKADYIYSYLRNNFNNDEIDNTLIELKRIIDERRKD